MTLVPKGRASEAHPMHYLRKGWEFLMRVSLNGRATKLDFEDVQLMTVFEPEIKMAAINRK